MKGDAPSADLAKRGSKKQIPSIWRNRVTHEQSSLSCVITGSTLITIDSHMFRGDLAIQRGGMCRHRQTHAYCTSSSTLAANLCNQPANTCKVKRRPGPSSFIYATIHSFWMLCGLKDA